MKISLRRDVACKVSRLRGLKSMFLRLWLEPKEILKLPLCKGARERTMAATTIDVVDTIDKAK